MHPNIVILPIKFQENELKCALVSIFLMCPKRRIIRKYKEHRTLRVHISIMAGQILPKFGIGGAPL